MAREAGASSIVLLKNEGEVLPLDKLQDIAVIGALADSKIDMLGSWATEGVKDEVVTVIEGIKNKFKNSNVTYSEGYDLETNELKLNDAYRAAANADVVVVAVGERACQSGEARSMAHIDVPKEHQKIVMDLKKRVRKLLFLLWEDVRLCSMKPYADSRCLVR